MPYKIITLSFDPTTGRFDDGPLNSFLTNKTVRRIEPGFFHHDVHGCTNAAMAGMPRSGDFVIFGDDKAILKYQHGKINDFVNRRLLLRMKEKATWLNRSSAGLSYLGMRIFPGMLRIRPENRNRCLKRLKKRQKAFEHRNLSESQLADSMTCVKAHFQYLCPGQKVIV